MILKFIYDSYKKFNHYAYYDLYFVDHIITI